MSEWISVDDKLPPYDEWVMVHHARMVAVALLCEATEDDWEGEDYWLDSYRNQVLGVTHWQPLPNKPEVET